MAPSSQSDDVLDSTQVTLQDASLPPPMQSVKDDGESSQETAPVRLLWNFSSDCD